MNQLFVLALAVSACGGATTQNAPRAAPAVALEAPACDTHATEPPVTTDNTTREAPPAAMRLLAATNELVVARPHPDHAGIVHALRALADALEAVVPERPTEIMRVRESSNELAYAPERADTHSDFVRAALDAAVSALAATEPRPNVDPVRYRDAVNELTVAATMVETQRPLLVQIDQVRAALRAATRAVFAAAGAPAPTIETAPTAQR